VACAAELSSEKSAVVESELLFTSFLVKNKLRRDIYSRRVFSSYMCVSTFFALSTQVVFLLLV
jgi:hypothetical protein